MGILSVVAQTAAIDCILAQDSPVTLQGQDPSLATVSQWADLAPEPSRLLTDLFLFLRANSPPPTKMLTHHRNHWNHWLALETFVGNVLAAERNLLFSFLCVFLDFFGCSSFWAKPS